ncbi:MAG: SpoVG family protein [Elusimicrobiaceae bacterium]|nr:SpoVG family protein [Elusimicrobiota bacterium]
MKITEIRIHLMGEERLKAFASVTFDDSFVVRNMKIVEGGKGVFLCMPSRKLPDGSHKDMVHPINQEFRKYLEENIIKAYQEELAKNQGGNSSEPEDKGPDTTEACLPVADK